MKKWTAIAFVLLMLFVCACAEDAAKEEFYSAPDDLCFHQHPACSGRSDLELIPDISGLFPCHICADDPVSHEIPEAFTLGDIVVIRMPDKWMNERPNIGTVFASWDKECYADYEADAVISKYLHGADYRNFLDSNGFPTYAYYPSIYGTTDYSQRHIGDSWYIVTHLPATDTATDSDGKPTTSAAQRTKDTWYGYLRFFGGRMWQQDGLTFYYMPAEWGDRDYSMPTEAMTEEPMFVSCKDDQRISVYKHEDIYLCEVVDTIDFNDFITVFLDGKPIESWLRILEGKLCFAVTGAEVFKLQNGAAIDYVTAFLEEKDFENSSFAISNNEFRYMDYYPCVIDRNGNQLTPDIYGYIVRYGNMFFCERRTYDVKEKINGIDVYDFTKSDEVLFSYTDPDASISFTAASDSVFLIEWESVGRKYMLCDIHTGEVISEFMPDIYDDIFIKADYVCSSGFIDKFCVVGDNGVYLTDLNSDVVARFDNYTSMVPLTWSNGHGLYLLVDGKEWGYVPREKALFRHGFDAGDYYLYFGEHEFYDPWDEEYETDSEAEEDGNIMRISISDITFALVNENGEFVTDAPFTYIRVIDEKQVEIGNRDGMRMIVETER